MTTRKLFGSICQLLLVLNTSQAFAAPAYKILHGFGSGQDGAGLWGSVVLDKLGNVYGTTSGGGEFGYGTVWELIRQGNGQWGESILHSFDPKAQDGYSSNGGLALNSSGNLFGTTCCGGAFDLGTVFELTPGTDDWTESVIYSLGTNPKDAGAPYAGVAIDAQGNLFGTTTHGGTVFEVSPSADGWTESVIANHDVASYAGVTLDSGGNVYGTTGGSVFEVHPAGDGTWHESMFNFCGSGSCPGGHSLGALATDDVNSVYGVTSGGGVNHCGTIYRLTREPGNVKLWELYSFQCDDTGYYPGAGVVRDQAGNLYGTTLYGGDPLCGCGVVYRLAPGAHDHWTYTVLHTFVGSDGAQPDANLTLDGKGHLFGAAATGGPDGYGVVFEITP
jgi:uncharacterized repeat protein (TIGR03803 family)